MHSLERKSLGISRDLLPGGARSVSTAEFSGQPFEQLGMGRCPRVEAKIIRRFDKTSTEVIVPDAICHDSDEERIARIRDPVRQVQATVRFDRVGPKSKTRVRSLNGSQTRRFHFIAQG